MSEEIFPQVAVEDFKGHFLHDMLASQYHGMRDHVSASGLKSVMESPAHFLNEFVRGHREAPSRAMRFGTMAHMAILEPARFRELVRIQPDMGDMRSSKNREQRDEWLKSLPMDAQVLNEEDYTSLMRMIDSVVEYKDPTTGQQIIMNMLSGASFEVSGFFIDPETKLKCRIRPDILRKDLRALPDLKTTRCAGKDFFSREIWTRKYYLQLAFYSFGVGQIMGKKPELPCFIAVENQAPFNVCVYEADEGLMSRGETAYRKALATIRRCLDENRWPGYQAGVAESIGLPTYTDWIAE